MKHICRHIGSAGHLKHITHVLIQDFLVLKETWITHRSHLNIRRTELVFGKGVKLKGLADRVEIILVNLW